MCTQKRQVAAA